jgi:hypothetical protein
VELSLDIFRQIGERGIVVRVGLLALLDLARMVNLWSLRV